MQLTVSRTPLASTPLLHPQPHCRLRNHIADFLRKQAPCRSRAHCQHSAAVVHAAPLGGGQLGAVRAVRLAQPQHGLHLRRAVPARCAARARRKAGKWKVVMGQ